MPSDRRTSPPVPPRDHGGSLSAAIAAFGGARGDWIDLSTGINPCAYPLPDLAPSDWTALPDRPAQQALEAAARRFWRVPDTASALAAPGASALIARLPALRPTGTVAIARPTYNEHAAAFSAARWRIADDMPGADAQVIVNPNNPDGRIWRAEELRAPFAVIDESFCDTAPEHSLIDHAAGPGRIVLKSFGKFWGLAGLRLGFAFGPPDLIAPLSDMLGPWPVSGPALRIGAAALTDTAWATQTRQRLAHDAARLDRIMTARGAALAGGTDLFRLYRVSAARRWQARLATVRIWSRIFPYSDNLLRLGLPHPDDWPRIEAAW
ncbi:MAG: pyridoxal phosphate-dependent class II aminotransferase [Rhodobacteraceae bacterium]|nr:pyridoxal phosphate-dependent class II aminotransferase [Paracoccaceae bacterium]